MDVFVPARTSRTLTVPNQYGTIQAAINAAAGLSPTAANPALVAIAPGTYTENLTFSPFVILSCSTAPPATASASGYDVIVSGTATYTAPADSASNAILVRGIDITGAVTINTASKTGGNDTYHFTNVVFGSTACTFTGRSALPADDVVRISNSRPTTATITDITVVLGANIGAGTMTLAGATACTSQDGNRLNTVVMTGTSTLTVESGAIMGNLSVASGCAADVRNCLRFGTLAGPGTINRSIINGTTGALSAGTGQTITFGVPMADANYNVQLTATATATLPVLVTAKASTGFTITVPTGGGTWDYTVSHN